MENKNYDFSADYPRILASILDIGEILLKSGAEVMRVEDTLSRLSCAYGFVKTDVFTITSSIVMTVKAPNGEIVSQTRRIMQRDNDLDRVARANNLSREICACPPPLSELQEKIEALHDGASYSKTVKLLTHGFVAAAFSVFFGGGVLDAVAAFIAGAILFGCLSLGTRVHLNSILLNTVCSAAMALSVIIMVSFGLGQNADKIIIGNIMLLIPGLALTTSLRDMINGDTISGLMGFTEAIMKALAIAIGSAAVLLGFGG